MKKMPLLTIVTLLLLVSLLGCSGGNTGQDKNSVVNQQIKIETNETKTTTSTLKLSMQIPVVTGLINTSWQDSINKTIMDGATALKNGIESDAQQYASDNYPYELSIGFKAYSNGDYLALIIENYLYSGGAHGGTWIECYNLDNKNSRELKLSDLFKEDSDYIGVLTDKIDAQIQEQIEKNDAYFFEENDEAFTTAAYNNRPFYIKENILFLCFGEYEIAPYAAGRPEFAIPLSELNQLLNEDFVHLLLEPGQ